jgi:hypothetical protein
MGGKLLIVGDFNIYVDVAGSVIACKYPSLLDSKDLTANQHDMQKCLLPTTKDYQHTQIPLAFCVYSAGSCIRPL